MSTVSLALERDFEDCYDVKEELLDGKVIRMASPNSRHSSIVSNIIGAFFYHLREGPCRIYTDLDVHLTEKDRVRPDIAIVCNPELVKTNGIHGPPDLIVEILSPSTRRRDRGYKKDLYERCGVSEFWIISPNDRSIEVYLLIDGKYRLDNSYEIIEQWELDMMNEKEREQAVTEFRPRLFGDLVINIHDIFKNID